ncbi:unnamed protein product [Linum trigynum]|uniref:Uncharacterized protein n=1 Tax=Linum trigynum TaxID=586398 RepID=A0AAV2DH13_9ROSI
MERAVSNRRITGHKFVEEEVRFRLPKGGLAVTEAYGRSFKGGCWEGKKIKWIPPPQTVTGGVDPPNPPARPPLEQLGAKEKGFDAASSMFKG